MPFHPRDLTIRVLIRLTTDAMRIVIVIGKNMAKNNKRKGSYKMLNHMKVTKMAMNK